MRLLPLLALCALALCGVPSCEEDANSSSTPPTPAPAPPAPDFGPRMEALAASMAEETKYLKIAAGGTALDAAQSKAYWEARGKTFATLSSLGDIMTSSPRSKPAISRAFDEKARSAAEARVSADKRYTEARKASRAGSLGTNPDPKVLGTQKETYVELATLGQWRVSAK